MNAQLDPTLLEKLKELPPERRAEVSDFVDFLIAKDRAAALKDFLAVANEAAKPGVPALSSQEIEGVLSVIRAARHGTAHAAASTSTASRT